jgi:hypothetical protein
VVFGDGAIVTKVSFASDFSAVRIGSLPRDTTVSDVIDLLLSLDFVVPADCIRILAPADGNHCSVDVRVEDPHFTKRLYGLPAMAGTMAQERFQAS